MKTHSRKKFRFNLFSRRALSVLLATLMLIGMLGAALTWLFTPSEAGNPVNLKDLNRNATVQQINLLPVETEGLANGVTSRTYMNIGTNDKETYLYTDVVVNADDTVDIKTTQDNWHNNSKHDTTSYIEVYTVIGQKINLAENPWMMMRWNGDGRANGRIYFTVTKDGVEQGYKGKTIPKGYLDTVTDPQVLIDNDDCRPLALHLKAIVDDTSSGYSSDNDTENDFNAATDHDYTVDLYQYLMKYKSTTYKDIDWPEGEEWKDTEKNYITIYMSCIIMVSESGQPLKTGTKLHWEKFALGREVLDRPASLLPRNQEYISITNNGADVEYGRVSKMDDGSVSFRNTSLTDSVTFTWRARNYFNATELESLVVDADYSGMEANAFKLQAWYGGRTTTYCYPSSYSYRGTQPPLSELIDLYGVTTNIGNGIYEAVIDFNEYATAYVPDDTTNYSGEYVKFYPDDSLIFVGDVQLTLPAGGKITFCKLEFQVENEAVPATKENTVYPWASAEKPDGLPPEGTAAVSTAIDQSGGVSYEWAASVSNAPVVAKKVDFLALKTLAFNKWDLTSIEAANTATNIVVDYERWSTGESYYSSKGQSAYTYYSLQHVTNSAMAQANNSWSGNYYLYLDLAVTPYFYYSYELIDTTPDDSVAPAAGLYFHFANANRDTYVSDGASTNAYAYYLDQTGMTVRQCNTFFTNDHQFAAEAIVSTTLSRTGCIDLSSLLQNSTEYLKFEELRIYLAPGTDIKINYCYMGSGSLASSAIGSIATQGGMTQPWATTKEQFDNQTDPDVNSSTITFANKVDVLADLNDRAHINGKNGLTTSIRDASTGAVTVTVSDEQANGNLSTGYFTSSGISFDHLWRLQVPAETDLASLRYLNYSVDAPAGMRWTIMFVENDAAGAEYATLTWSDAWSRKDDDLTSTPVPSGNIYFRYMSQSIYQSSWQGQNDTSWRIYTIPGSQTGCVDLMQVSSTFRWDSIIGIYLVAYRDPSLTLKGDDTASVTFNYVYLTSEPIDKSGVGQAATTPGTKYTWGNTAVTKPTVATEYAFSYTGKSETATSEATLVMLDYTLSNTSVNLTQTPFLYYSFRFIDKTTGQTVRADGTPLRVGISIYENDSYYYRRTTSGNDSNASHNIAADIGTNRGHGKPSFLRLSTDVNVTEGKMQESVYYYVNGSETVCINLADYFISDANVLNRIRFYVDKTMYDDNCELVVDYLFLGTAATSAAPSFVKKEPYASPSAPVPADYQKTLLADNTTVSAQTYTLDQPIEVDLSQTPYLYYSMQYTGGVRGTFGLMTDQTIDGSNIVYRAVGLANNVLVASGAQPDSTQYMLQSETGCINMAKWYAGNGFTGNIIKISAVQFWGGVGTLQYLYFGAAADKTIDLIPSHAGGTLDSGTPTAAWVVQTTNGVYGELTSSDGEWDVYDESTKGSLGLPTTSVKFSEDLTNDGFNDLKYANTSWSMGSICYGSIVHGGDINNYNYISTGNNQTSGLTIDLNETPYLHFSFEQPEDSVTAFTLQANNFTASADMYGKPANAVKPWLSAYCPTSPAGQLIQIVAEPNIIAYYKDDIMENNAAVLVSGDFGGVIDLRSWFTVTNGFANVMNLERIRFYTIDRYGTKTDVKINHLYLSSSAGAAYTVTFNKNDGETAAYEQKILKNANDQYVSDVAVSHLKQRDGYTFIGWYTDSACNNYFDIANTPLTHDITLYAGWIKNSDIVSGNEVDFLRFMQTASASVTGTGSFELNQEILSIKNTGDGAYTVKFPIQKAYSLKTLQAMFLGFDTDKTSGGFDIAFDIKTTDTATKVSTYRLVNEAFSASFLTANGLLTAGPYDKELAFRTYLEARNLLPASENTDELVYVDAITLTVPAGVNSHVRYLKAIKQTEKYFGTENIPNITNATDLLKDTGSADFVNKQSHVVYQTLSSKATSYNGDQYYNAYLNGVERGYAHIGGLYSHTIILPRTNVTGTNQYLYFSITQPAGSKVSFALYASFNGLVEGENKGTADVPVYDVSMPKSIAYYNGTTLAAKDTTVPDEGYIPVETVYMDETTIVGKVDLHAFYADALKPYRNVSTVTSVELLGIRFFTSDATTDATINYMVLGGEVDNGDSFAVYAAYPDSADVESTDNHYSHVLAEIAYKGQVFHVSLDQLHDLADVAPIDDPTKIFLGWNFRECQDPGELVYWNPDATNGKEYHETDNPGGSWSLTYQEGFVTNLKTVYYAFNTLNNHNTQVIVPVWGNADYAPKLSVTKTGSGTVSVISDSGQTVSDTGDSWTVPYGNTVVLRAATADGAVFDGWYDQNGRLLSTSRDYAVAMYTDMTVEARFAQTAQTLDPVIDTVRKGTTTVVWLQAGDASAGTAGETFYLQSIYGGQVAAAFTTLSNIQDTADATQIACYWEIVDSQVLKAVAPDGYHWEQLVSDGSTVRVSSGSEYVFVAAVDIKLVCVANASAQAFEGEIAMNEFSVCLDREPNNIDGSMIVGQTFVGQVLPKDGEELLSCGIVIVDADAVSNVPSVGSADSQTITASAWNSTTGQFAIEIPVKDAKSYFVRSYAILFDNTTQEYTLRYGSLTSAVV